MTIYCYETKEKFSSINKAAKKYDVGASDIIKVLDNPNRTSASYHWCTDLAIFDNVKLTYNKTPVSQVVYCYETKEKFNNVTEAARKYNAPSRCIRKILDNPNKSSGGYHWCTDLAIFDGVELSEPRTREVMVYCYETKERFNSIKEAQAKYNTESISIALNKSYKTAAGHHWCTDLAIFDGVELYIGQNYKKEIYCYETKEKFDSISEAKRKYKCSSSTDIGKVLNDPNRTAAGHHWCTDLAIFDGVELSIGQTYKKVIYCYETKEKFDSIAEAQAKYNIESSLIGQILDDPTRTAASFHWCTSLDIFDEIKDTLSIGQTYKKVIYCYETKEKFDSITEAQNKYNIGGIGQVLDNPNRTSGNYHWCTDLSLINPNDLVYPEAGISSQEKEIADFIKSIYKQEVIENSRNIISPYELDIYIPDLKLAFEFNGDYWHSEQAGKHKNYHINKTNLCKSKGIYLIHIFEYQYRENPVIIKSMIMNKLNKNPIKLYARNCEVKLITNINEIRNFLEENHIQGFVYSDINLGLYCNNILVSLMTFGKSRFDKSIEYELLRYACLRSTNVIGGASKLLKYFEKIYKPKSLVSYADISYSNGNLYDKLGFDYISTSKPDYISIRNGIVYPRFKTMKHKLPKLLGEENFDINLTEQQNLDNNRFYRIWKCGNLKYLKEYNN